MLRLDFGVHLEMDDGICRLWRDLTRVLRQISIKQKVVHQQSIWYPCCFNGRLLILCSRIAPRFSRYQVNRSVQLMSKSGLCSCETEIIQEPLRYTRIMQHLSTHLKLRNVTGVDFNHVILVLVVFRGRCRFVTNN